MIFFGFLNNLFAGTKNDDPIDYFGWLEYISPITEDRRNNLLQPCTNEEIKRTAFSSKPLKSPGPDGFLSILNLNGTRWEKKFVKWFILSFLVDIC